MKKFFIIFLFLTIRIFGQTEYSQSMSQMIRERGKGILIYQQANQAFVATSGSFVSYRNENSSTRFHVFRSEIKLPFKLIRSPWIVIVKKFRSSISPGEETVIGLKWNSE